MDPKPHGDNLHILLTEIGLKGNSFFFNDIPLKDLNKYRIYSVLWRIDSRGHLACSQRETIMRCAKKHICATT